jgi:hypothetical protein
MNESNKEERSLTWKTDEKEKDEIGEKKGTTTVLITRRRKTPDIA